MEKPSFRGEGVGRALESLAAALRATDGNVAAAARQLGVCSPTVSRRAKKEGFDLATLRGELDADAER